MSNPSQERESSIGLLPFPHYRLSRLQEKHGRRPVLATFNLVNGAVSIALISTLALITQEALIFPSLGATAFILFYVPLAEPASPRNTLIGHLTGAIAGFLSLAIFGLLDAPSAVANGVDGARVGAAALSLGACGGLMILLHSPHPPAGATALIVSLGLMPHPGQLPILIAGVVLLVVQAFIMNRLAGIPYPLWRSR
ncbi:HPP family protein [Halovibrio salipaludis]|uniref:HPP family protein n=1 Tax=Halovibrio salipaludis TaxID=2032626 RepID=A0A2A2F5C8_9GAMM|nr:HPP family protein [Halovibrio salipaludis]PAU79812.1 HPP family protein [Halovibrio salipaludis]